MNASIQLLRHVLPSVVQLKATVPQGHPSTVILGPQRMGTGTIVDRSGLVLTVNYVLIGASEVEATLFDGRTVEAEIVAQDFASGVGLLKISGTGYIPAPLRKSNNLQTGEDVFLVASVGNGGPRVSTGAVSYLGPFDAYWEYLLDRCIMATVMSPGVGGGPMFDLAGRMIGITSLNLNEVGRFSLAVPMEYYLDYREELLKHGRQGYRPRRAWVGLYCYTLQEHVVVVGLMPGAPGQVAGLKSGDVVLAINGVAVSERRELYRQLWLHRPGEQVVFRIFRDNEVKLIEISTTSVEQMFA